MLDKTYKSMNNQIIPDKDLIEKTKNGMRIELEKVKGPHRTFFRQPLALAVVICVFIMVSIPIMAATIPSFNRLLYIVSPDIAQYLQPIELSSVSNDIEVDVVAAMNDDDMVYVYLTMEDLASDRIDSTIDLYNYTIRAASMFTSELVNYDEAAKKATIRMIASGAKNLNGKKITVQLDSFLSGKQYYKDVALNIDTKDIPNIKAETMSISSPGGGGGDGYRELMEQENVSILKPGQINTKVRDDMDFVSISSIGYIDGLLHIQTEWEESIDNHGYISLDKENGDRVYPYANFSFGIDGKKYQEEIYQIPVQEIGHYSLIGNYTRDGYYVEGDWNVTFKINTDDSSWIKIKDFKAGGLQIDELSITPIGLTIIGKVTDTDNVDVEIVKNDGSKITSGYTLNEKDDGVVRYKHIFELPIDVQSIKEVRINGNIIPLQ